MCRNAHGDLSALKAEAKVIGEHRWVIEKIAKGTNWGVFDLADGPSIWMDSNLGHLPVGALRFAEAGVRELLDKHNISADQPVVRRLDLTTDVGFGDAVEAQRALVAFSAVSAAHHKLCVYYAKGSKKIESVSWIVGKSIRLRVYDSLARDPKRKVDGFAGLLRIEHQHMPTKPNQVPVDTIMGRDLSGLATAPLTVGQDGSRIVADLHALNAILKRRSPVTSKGDAVAERQLGTLVRAYLGGRDEWQVSRHADDRASELRKLGLSLHPDLPEPTDLGPLLAAVRAVWTP